MPETTQQMHARDVAGLRVPDTDGWDSWPFVGELGVKELRPLQPEPARDGEGGTDCPACLKGDSDRVWTSERWRLSAMGPSGLPLVLLLEPRQHLDAPAELPDALAAESGILLGRVERAILTLKTVGRVHIGKWDEGAAHLHWWFPARRQGFTQLCSSFAEIWDSVLPPTARDLWAENVARVVAALREQDTTP